MKIAIVEDEPLTLNRIRNIINAQNADLEVVGTAQSNRELLELLNSDIQIDLLLCDIHLADGLSFNVLKDKAISFPIIFVTAYDKYALESFEHNCIDYILKPIQEERLLKAFDKVKTLKSQPLDLAQINADFLKNMMMGYQSKEYKKRFLTKSGNKIRFVNADDIAYFYSYEGITYVYEKETKKKSIVEFTLSELESHLLDPSKFFRVSRSVIIQLDDLVEMRPYQNGRMMLMLNSQPEADIIVARDRVNDFKNWINQ